MRWLCWVALVACNPTFGPPSEEPPQAAHDAFDETAYPALLAHYFASCVSNAPATAFPGLLCSSDPYDALVANPTAFGSYEQARAVLVEGAPPGEVLPWDPDGVQQVLAWLDLEGAACRWAGECPSSDWQ